MDQRFVRQRLEDFMRFCDSVEIGCGAAASNRGSRAPGYDKERYALAILRAAKTGAFGDDAELTRTAISAIWDRGYRSGFNPDSFKTEFEQYFRCW